MHLVEDGSSSPRNLVGEEWILEDRDHRHGEKQVLFDLHLLGACHDLRNAPR
jgi:hypothetical protein